MGTAPRLGGNFRLGLAFGLIFDQRQGFDLERVVVLAPFASVEDRAWDFADREVGKGVSVSALERFAADQECAPIANFIRESLKLFMGEAVGRDIDKVGFRRMAM